MRILTFLFYSVCALTFVLFTAKTLLIPEIPIEQLYSKFVVVMVDQSPNASSTPNYEIMNIFDNFSSSIAPEFELSTSTTDNDPDSVDRQPLILFWNFANFWGPNEDIDSLEQINDTQFNVCPSDAQCRITRNQSLIEESSAVIIRLRSFEWKHLPTNLTRQPDQYFVMVEFESPAQEHYVDMTGHEEFFNLTMTYRYDSDIVFPFAYFVPYERPRNQTELAIETHRLENVTNGKTKLIAWFASNCLHARSNRNLVVQRMEQYLSVDKYGKCGNLSCPKAKGSWKSSTTCYDMVTRDYKFYLSLENSICKDYITEKFFDVLRVITAIPIVFERRQILDMIREEEIAEVANTSFIAVDDFKSVEELANYMKYLDRNTTAYLEYFEWRKEYRVIKDRTMKIPGCELCRIVKEKKPRVFTDIQNWWYNTGDCHSYN